MAPLVALRPRDPLVARMCMSETSEEEEDAEEFTPEGGSVESDALLARARELVKERSPRKLMGCLEGLKEGGLQAEETEKVSMKFCLHPRSMFSPSLFGCW